MTAIGCFVLALLPLCLPVLKKKKNSPGLVRIIACSACKTTTTEGEHDDFDEQGLLAADVAGIIIISNPARWFFMTKEPRYCCVGRSFAEYVKST